MLGEGQQFSDDTERPASINEYAAETAGTPRDELYAPIDYTAAETYDAALPRAMRPDVTEHESLLPYVKGATYGLSEWNLLCGYDVAATPDTTATDPEAEAKRSWCSIECWQQLREGGDENYEAFTAPQDPAVRLTRPEFDELHTEARLLAPDGETGVAIEVAMLYHDIFKANGHMNKQGLTRMK